MFTSSLEGCLALCAEFRPVLVVLDVTATSRATWAVLHQLSHHSATWHTPVVVLAPNATDAARAHGAGAFAMLDSTALDRANLQEAISRALSFADAHTRRLLVASSDPAVVGGVEELIGVKDVEIRAAATGEEAHRIVEEWPPDGIVFDPGVADIHGAALARSLVAASRDQARLIVYGATPSEADEAEFASLGVAPCPSHESANELLYALVRALRIPSGKLSRSELAAIAEADQRSDALEGRRVLIIDDDARNIFALASALEREGVEILYAENGIRGIEKLEQAPDVDVVLMDIMMPEMDGYETTRRIRKIPRFEALPILALTAKAMKGDREKCLEAGASGYVTKPVDTAELVALLRSWVAERPRVSGR
jgi:CheY-like chemotaxis protein